MLECLGLEAHGDEGRFYGVWELVCVIMEAWVLYTWVNVLWCELWVLNGSETHGNGNFDKRWVFDDLHACAYVVWFLLHIWLVGFICFLSKFPSTIGTFQNFGAWKRFYIHLCLLESSVMNCYKFVLGNLGFYGNDRSWWVVSKMCVRITNKDNDSSRE